MKQLREHIRKEITNLMEKKYPAPPEIINALKNDLMLTPLIRFVKELKAVNSPKPTYEIRLLNGTSFFIIMEPPLPSYEDFSLKAKIGPKTYYLGDLEEKNLAIDHIERLLTQPLFNPDAGEGEEFEEPAGETGETGGETGGADDVAMEPDEEIQEDEQTT